MPSTSSSPKVLAMTQADLDRALARIKQLETKISELHAKIARIREQGFPIEPEQEQLYASQRALEMLKTHVGNATAPERKSA
jgi:hypothetical protein